MNNKINVKQLIISILTPFIFSFVSFLLFRTGTGSYSSMVKPFLSPPPIVFQIVWPILYFLMGVSFYLVTNSKSGATDNIDYNIHKKRSATRIYYLQLFINVLWPIIFFRYNLYFISFLVLIILLCLVVIMFFKFYSIDKKAALLQVPYILWLTFAGYLNLAIYLLNEAF